MIETDYSTMRAKDKLAIFAKSLPQDERRSITIVLDMMFAADRATLNAWLDGIHDVVERSQEAVIDHIRETLRHEWWAEDNGGTFPLSKEELSLFVLAEQAKPKVRVTYPATFHPQGSINTTYGVSGACVGIQTKMPLAPYPAAPNSGEDEDEA